MHPEREINIRTVAQLGRAGNGKIISLGGQLPFTSELLTPWLRVRVPSVLQKTTKKGQTEVTSLF